MIALKLATIGEKLNFVERPVIASGDQNSVFLDVNCSADWDGYTLSAVFFTDKNNTVYEKLLVDNLCTIPNEVLVDEATLYIGIRGFKTSDSNDMILTSTLEKCKISKGAPVGTGVEVEPTPSMYEQILSAYQATNGNVDNAIDKVKALGARLDAVSATRVTEPEQYVFTDFILPEGASSIDGEITFSSNGIYAKISGYIHCVFNVRNDAGEIWIGYGNYVKVLTVSEELSLLDCGDNFASDVKPDDYKGWAIRGNDFYIDAPRTVLEGYEDFYFYFEMDNYVPLTYPYSNSDLAFEVADARIDNDGTAYESLGAIIRFLSQKVSGSEDELVKVGEDIDSLKTNVENKVDKAVGKSLIDDTEIERLSKVKNYDDTKVKEAVSELNEKKITKFYANNLGETTLTDSDNGKIQDMILYGKSEQKQYSGYNLLDFSNAKGGSNVGVTVTINDDGSYSYVGTPTDSNVNVWLFGNYVYDTPILTLAPGKYFVKGVNLYYNSTSIFTGGRNGGFITLTEDTPIAGIRAVSGYVGTSYNETWYPIIAKSDVEVPWEPYVGGIPSPNPGYPQEIKSVVNPVITLSDGENSQTVTLPFTLNAIPVSEGGNVTIDGQQYVADYVDVERGKIVQCVGFFNGNVFSYDEPRTRWFYGYDNAKIKTDPSEIYSLCNKYPYASNSGNNTYRTGSDSYSRMFLIHDVVDADLSDVVIYTALEVPTETDLTDEQVNALKALSSYYPTTNVAVTSDELDGYVTFNYPVSLANGWNYVKQQLGDTRSFIYDMELQTLESYINSEYAVALAELEV